jgi:hypothetical protein
MRWFRDRKLELLEAIHMDTQVMVAGLWRIENDIFQIGKLLEDGMTPLEQRAVARRLGSIATRLRQIAKPQTKEIENGNSP